jgi:hypothetical protein
MTSAARLKVSCARNADPHSLNPEGSHDTIIGEKVAENRHSGYERGDVVPACGADQTITDRHVSGVEAGSVARATHAYRVETGA